MRIVKSLHFLEKNLLVEGVQITQFVVNILFSKKKSSLEI